MFTGLLASNCHNRVETQNRRPAVCLAREGGRRVATRNACSRRFELEDHIESAIAIDILQTRLQCCRLRADFAEADCGRVDCGCIESLSCENGNRDDALFFWIDGGRDAPG